MEHPLDRIAQAACDLADQMPPATLRQLARLIATSLNSAAARIRIAEAFPQPYYRDLALKFLELWEGSTEGVTSTAISLCLLTASCAEHRHQQDQSVELVWTGPDTGAVPFRRTEQALLQVLDSAQHRITLVSYAVYRIPNVADALIRAIRRGVQVQIIMETPDPGEGEREYDTLRPLGEEVAAACRVYDWPHERRHP